MEVPSSPSGKNAALDDDALSLQLQQFLDEWYYRIIASSIGRIWTRQKATVLLLDIFGMLGFEIPAKEKERLAGASENEFISALIAAMPAMVREQFEGICLQIQTVLHEAARIRTAAEAGDVAVAELFDEDGSDRGGLSSQVLKASVIFAAKEVQKLRKIHTTWRKNTDERIDRLLMASEEAEHANQNLLAIESQLQAYKGEAKSKSKGMLLSMAEGKESALVHSVFSSWHGYIEKVHAENGIRKKFEDQIKNLERKLFQYKEAQIANVRGVFGRLHMEETEALMHTVWKIWVDEVAQHKADGDTAEQLKAVQAKMAALDKSQKNKAGQFMTRMAAGNEASLKNLCLEAWIKFHEDYAKDKELEDQVKAQELAFKKHLEQKKDEAKTVLDRMSASSDTGLMALMMQNWIQYMTEEKKAKELEYALLENESKFKSLNGRQKQGASSMQTRVNEQMHANLLQRCLNAWLVETKVTRVEKHYTNKYESKKRQLQGVQNLFKSFAMQLEQNLGTDDDSSSRTHRTGKKEHRSSKAGMSKGDGSVSLPDIHQKVPA
mmetsp:Transcript_120864/g.189584  ORF Transcript_120864/g.189584 Transcript_120864/m.189584 type:complete len:551 (+) Transcript_120864:62-1714(+)